MKIIIDKDRKLVRIEAEDFMLRLNGKSNAEYKAILKLVGIELTIESGAETPVNAIEAETMDGVNAATDAS
ncbi:MAG: hypothetical protein NUV75_00565 [Gallionella sp.]|nr:hypothetical protein [Gallionella sp.]